MDSHSRYWGKKKEGKQTNKQKSQSTLGELEDLSRCLEAEFKSIQDMPNVCICCFQRHLVSDHDQNFYQECCQKHTSCISHISIFSILDLEMCCLSLLGWSSYVKLYKYHNTHVSIWTKYETEKNQSFTTQ